MTSDPLFALKLIFFFYFRSRGVCITLPAGLAAIVSRLGLRAADAQPKCLKKSWQVFPLVWPNKFPHLTSRTDAAEICFCSFDY